MYQSAPTATPFYDASPPWQADQDYPPVGATVRLGPIVWTFTDDVDELPGWRAGLRPGEAVTATTGPVPPFSHLGIALGRTWAEDQADPGPIAPPGWDTIADRIGTALGTDRVRVIVEGNQFRALAAAATALVELIQASATREGCTFAITLNTAKARIAVRVQHTDDEVARDVVFDLDEALALTTRRTDVYPPGVRVFHCAGQWRGIWVDVATVLGVPEGLRRPDVDDRVDLELLRNLTAQGAQEAGHA